MGFGDYKYVGGKKSKNKWKKRGYSNSCIYDDHDKGFFEQLPVCMVLNGWKLEHVTNQMGHCDNYFYYVVCALQIHDRASRPGRWEVYGQAAEGVCQYGDGQWRVLPLGVPSHVRHHLHAHQWYAASLVLSFVFEFGQRYGQLCLLRYLLQGDEV